MHHTFPAHAHPMYLIRLPLRCHLFTTNPHPAAPLVRRAPPLCPRHADLRRQHRRKVRKQQVLVRQRQAQQAVEEASHVADLLGGVARLGRPAGRDVVRRRVAPAAHAGGLARVGRRRDAEHAAVLPKARMQRRHMRTVQRLIVKAVELG
eukprot:349757-Chlamydomonas_euryale.AAC.1